MEAPPPEPRSRRAYPLLLVLVALIALAYLARSGRLPRPFRPALHLGIAFGDPKVIGPGQYINWEFELPDRVCTVSAQVATTAPAKATVYAALMGRGDFLQFTANHKSRVFWDTTAGAASASVGIQGPGTFHLVVSNHFSLAGSKTAETTASAACP